MRTPNPVPVRIVAYPTGGGIVEVDGVDVSDGTERVWLEMGDGPPVVTLQRAADAVAVEGAAIVKVAVPESGLGTAAEFVQSLDAEALYENLRANNTHRTSPAGLVQLTLDAVAAALEAT